MLKLLKIICCLFLLDSVASAQCSTPGQNPSTAFPVCATSIFHQTTVPLCYTHTLTVPGCPNSNNASYQDLNPFWYKFTCFQSGTLGFLITPNDLGDDYDWQLYDVTGHDDPSDVFTDASLVVTGNWSGSYGKTGASNSGVAFIQCASNPNRQKTNTFAKMPALTKGHTYLLLISHFDNTQSGYDLSFGGGTAVITDPDIPHLKTVEVNCESNLLHVKLGKNIKCSSIAANGSDFSINVSGITITNAAGINCSTKFDTDSLELQLSAPLPPGKYTLGIKAGSDNNTLLDFCDNQVPLTDALEVTILPKQPTLMDSLMPVACAPQQVTLVFKKPIRCGSIAPDGSNFIVTGTYPVPVTAAAGDCSNDLSKVIKITFSKPLLQTGTFTVTLQKDFDGNTIIDECGEETPAGSRLSFSVKDTVNAAFTYAVKYGCVRDTIALFHDGANGITTWNWDLDNRQHNTNQNTQGIYTDFNEKKINLIVSNGFCSDTSSQTVLLDNFLKADFTTFEDICPLEPVLFTGTPQGKIRSHLWEFGDGSTANTQTPSYTFPAPERQRTFSVRYTVTDSLGCKSTAAKTITIYTSCYLAVPTAFTPNGDGLNDFLAPLNAIKATNLEFRIFNRWGQLIFTTTNWKRGWDGTLKGQLQPTATYVWMLQYTARDTGKKQQLKGTAVLIR